LPLLLLVLKTKSLVFCLESPSMATTLVPPHHLFGLLLHHDS